MATIQIEVKDLLYPTLERISSSHGLTPEKYAGNIVESWLEGQYRGTVIDKVKLAKVEDLAVLEENTLSDLAVKQIDPIIIKEIK